MDVLFVDVGFGNCSIILTGSGEAVVIDAGERSKEPLAVLHDFSVKHVSHLIVSHWHKDHVGGATGVLRAYSGKIGTIWFPADPAFRKTEFWRALVDERRSGAIQDSQVQALMLHAEPTSVIWSNAQSGAELRLISPYFIESNLGVAAGDSNATCGVMLLRVGASLIVFAGDAVLSQWEEVAKRVTVPLMAAVLAVPHHAGIIWPDGWTAAQISTALDQLYSKIVRSKVAVISAGTRPGTKHPREDVVAALRRAGVQIMCTQMTTRCTSSLEEVRKLRAALPLVAAGRSSSAPIRTQAGNPNHVACAGSVIVELLASGATVQQAQVHAKFVGSIPNSAGQLPLCRR
jgi:competence protein ComEC